MSNSDDPNFNAECREHCHRTPNGYLLHCGMCHGVEGEAMKDNPCGHADHEYNPWAERHECCDSRYCRCPCDGAKEREERYARYVAMWKANPVEALKQAREDYEKQWEAYDAGGFE